MSDASLPHCAVCRRVEYDCACRGEDNAYGTLPHGVPGLVCEAVLALGTIPDALTDQEYHAACCAALDTLPQGRAAAIQAVQRIVRTHAEAHGWSDWILDPVTGKYPWE